MSDPTGGGEDYIYRGDDSGPQDGVSWNAPSPPPPGPPAPTPVPTTPPPGFPPQQPPVGQPVPGMAQPEKKKRWPWILAAGFFLCALPLGGCVALIGFGVNEIGERTEAIENTVDEFLDASNAEDLDVVEGVSDGLQPCSSPNDLLQATAELEGDWEFTIAGSAFVERSENSSFSNNADPETLVIEGRENESAAIAEGEIVAENGRRDFQITLSKPLSNWRICTIGLR